MKEGRKAGEKKTSPIRPLFFFGRVVLAKAPSFFCLSDHILGRVSIRLGYSLKVRRALKMSIIKQSCFHIR